ncbi:MAG: hypothetical protein NT062_15890 [Proteobacteria bacterium]|nr:hypothetical protein [Pseudomonadota bacterium]
MKLPQFFGLIDLGVVTVLVVLAVLPPREQFAKPAHKGDSAAQFALALVEARVQAKPDDATAIADLGRRMGEAGFKDWAVETTVHATDHMVPTSPDRWRALLATSVAYVDRLDIKAGLEQASLALNACHANAASCPSWEEIRMSLYQQHLDAGARSGIDPRRDPRGFRRAGEAALRPIRIGNTPDDRPAPPTTPTPTPTPTPAPAP